MTVPPLLTVAAAVAAAAAEPPVANEKLLRPLPEEFFDGLKRDVLGGKAILIPRRMWGRSHFPPSTSRFSRATAFRVRVKMSSQIPAYPAKKRRVKTRIGPLPLFSHPLKR